VRGILIIIFVVVIINISITIYRLSTRICGILGLKMMMPMMMPQLCHRAGACWRKSR
jgi:hypothetical protein